MWPNDQWQDWQPEFIQQSELALFGLPGTGTQANIMSLVDGASGMLDIYCGTKDAEGYGSLLWSTYTERVVVKTSRVPNVFRVSNRPLVGVSAATLTAYAASGFSNNVQATPDGSFRMNGDYPGELNAILSLSGRYGNARNDDIVSDILPYLVPANLIQLYGGPPQWYAMDPNGTDYNPRTAQVWAPPGIYLWKFSEVNITYTAGFDPYHIPRALKQCCAMVVKNMLAKPIPGLKSANFTDAALLMQYAELWIDPNVDLQLSPFKRAMYG